MVVCDGFVGNVALKTSEGVATMIRHFMQRGILTQSAHQTRRRHSPCRYLRHSAVASIRAAITAPVCSVCSGIVIKSHGGADAFAFANAISMAMLEVDKAVPRPLDPTCWKHSLTQRQIDLKYARITGTGGYLPEKVLTNADLE